MPLVAINAGASGWTPHGACPQGPRPWLAETLARTPAASPVVIMIHGYRYAPGARRPDDPHRTIFSGGDATHPGVFSWPHHLHLPRDADGALGIGFAWDGLGTLWGARARAVKAGAALAALLTDIAALSPGRRVTAMVHSLGATVLSSALHQAPPASLSRAVILSGALMRHEALAALRQDAARGVEFINVTSAENLIFDAGYAALMRGVMGRRLGRGLGAVHRGWVDLAIDRPEALAALAGLGFRIAGPERRICHWSSYLRPGIFELYRALLTDPVPLPLGLLADALIRSLPPRQRRPGAPMVPPSRSGLRT